ncbi:MAG: 5-formyltetrahydrofolate cyclo-ligase [Clostridia bacterium]|nr:5-formyltetrahydrofolate cyclo-ligase [Clostridia bacterium]
MEKKILRKRYLEIRKKIKDRSQKSKGIFEKIIQEKEYQNAKVIALYKSLESEVDTSELIEYSIEQERIVCLPKVVGEEIKFYQISEAEEFIKSKFGVEEPDENPEKEVAKNQIDLVIVPGVCFDTRKNRLGFGKGYYDRFLTGTNLKTIGICFEEQILKDGFLPVEENDVKMQKIVTEENVY